MVAIPASYDTTYWTVSDTEVSQVLANSGLVLADAVLEEGYRRVYSMESNCGEVKGLKCLFLYLYLLQNYKLSTTTSAVSQEAIMAALSKVEQISKSCCNGM